jgi:hypothetical protein
MLVREFALPSSTFTLITIFLVDKTGGRFFHMMGWWWSVILGFIIALSTMSTAGRYISLFFMASGFVGKALIRRVGVFTEIFSWISQKVLL